MIFTLEDMKKVTFGALEVTQNDGFFAFSRFTDEQIEYYKATTPDYHKKATATASVMLDFMTDAAELSFSYRILQAVSTTYAGLDVYENDSLVLHAGDDNCSTAVGEVKIALSDGTKRIRVYLPNLQNAQLSELTLTGGTYTPVKKSTKALIYGDSITHGYYARYPSLSYANTLARDLEWDAVNQAIGAEKFNPGLVRDKKLLDADIITVAYGTNDWCTWGDPETSEKLAVDFFSNLRALYPDAMIIYISPIWRRNLGQITAVGSFDDAIKIYSEAARKCGAEVIDGLTLTAHEEGMFTDGLHPNDLGFTQYAKILGSKIKEIVDKK